MKSLARQLHGIVAVNRGTLAAFGRERPYAFCRVSSGKSPAAGLDSRAAARRSRLEAILFLARQPLGLRKLAQLANLADATEARTLLRSLRERYDGRGCAFQVAQVAGGYQLLSRREFAPWLRPQGAPEREIRLSPPALETLAVVAYRQPVLRAEVEAIRGVACGEILRQLMDRDLLRIVGRSEELGRPLRYGTTKRFLEVYGLSNLDQLPWSDQLRRSSQSDESNDDWSTTKSVSHSGLTTDAEAA
ncbi:MAG: SMC-Scp complex subunit ScpB [Planctomycetes bacterium]|nr:SMC-Scp complex subunit ScpB [Planctomycetota bacterium]